VIVLVSWPLEPAAVWLAAAGVIPWAAADSQRDI
jgi:hypothetical protein